MLVAVAPHIRFVRRLLRVPEELTSDPAPQVPPRFDEAKHPSMAPGRGSVDLKELTGTFVRATAPKIGPLDVSRHARVGGRFHVPGTPPPLYASSDAHAALAELARHAPLRGSAAIGVQRRVSTFDVQALRVLDLTDPPTLLKLGVGLDTVMSLDNDRTQALANVAVSLGAEGLLAPSRVSSQAKVLVVFEHALDRVLVRKSELSVLRLPDDLDDPVVRARLAVDETMLRGFAAALSDERFDEWVASLTTVTDDLRERLRSSGRSLTD